MLHQTSPAAAHGQQQSKADMGNGDLSRNSNIATPLRAGLARRLPAGACQQPSSPQQGGLPGSPMQFTVVQAGPASPHQLPARAFSPSQRVQLPGTTGPDVSPIASPHHEEKQDAAKVSVIAPGGGTGINGQVYANLGQDPAFVVDIVGRSRAPYDCYPETWPHGRPAPNLVSFAQTVIRQGNIDSTDCIIVGSRGGQIVLPTIWGHRGDLSPPAVVLNGGCAMGLPTKVSWPRAAVTFLLIGGQDYFRGGASVDEYVSDTKSWVPANNATTAVLYVDEMTHMPQPELLAALLRHMVRAVMSWHSTRRAPVEMFNDVLAALKDGGWSGRFSYTRGPGEWSPEERVGKFRNQFVPTASVAGAASKSKQFVELTREQEYRELLRAAAVAASGRSKKERPRQSERGHAVSRSVSIAVEHISRPAQLSAQTNMGVASALSPRSAQRTTGTSLSLPITKRTFSFESARSEACSPSARSMGTVYQSPMSSEVGGYSFSPMNFVCTSPVLVTRSPAHSLQVALPRA
mmetsp:Transcript_110924/g.318663  ORF Transcript_110924/g.318663 Transcript_110924/m.318663 type:complete len:519 (+) Transcript_110924:100-1656(+)